MKFNSDLASPFNSYDAQDRLVDGSFNQANEIVQMAQGESGSAQVTLPFAYDAAGLLEQKAIYLSGGGTNQYRYRHDAWGRLVKVEYYDGSAWRPRGEYRSNPLHMRVMRQEDRVVTDGTHTLNEQRVMYYSPGWQLLEEHIDNEAPFTADSMSDVDRLTQTVWGIRHIDDAILRRQNNNYAGGADTDYSDVSGPGDRSGDYVLSDHQYSTVALITSSAGLVERIDYDAYGEARHHWARDVDVDATDAAVGTGGPYRPSSGRR